MIMAWLAGHGPAPADPLAAEKLARVRDEVQAAHFCMAASRSNSPQAFAESIANQLTANVPGFGAALAATLAERVQINVTQQIGAVQAGATVTGVAIGRLDLGTLGDELSFDRAFTQPVKKLYEDGYDKPLLMLVDALDEAVTYTGATNLVQLLAKLADLPPQVRILATTRPDPRVTKYFRDAKLFDLIADAPPDVDDVRVYTLGRLARAEGLDAVAAAALADRISAAAKGIFLYAAIVLDELLSHLPDWPVLDLENYPLPDGLSGLYHDFLNRELGRDEDRWYGSFKPVLGLIAVAQGAGLMRAQLAAISGVEVEQPLRVCKQYLAGDLPDGPFRVFHKSFADFLLEDDGNVDYRIDGSAMHGRIANYYWQAYHSDWSRCDAYGLKRLATHLYQGEQFDRLAGLISQPWMVARFNSSNYTYDGFIADLTLAWQRAHAEALRQSADEQQPRALADCVRYALLHTSINSLASNTIPELVGRALETGLWSPERALSVAANMQVAEQRSVMLTAILKTGKLPTTQRQIALQQALAAAQAIGDERYRAQALAALAPQLTGEAHQQALAQALAASQAIADAGTRANALAALAPQLIGEARQQALAQALAANQAVGDEGRLAEALAALASQLTGELLAQALAASQAIDDEQYRADTLAALAPQLTGDLLAQALAVAWAIGDEGNRAQALAALAPQLTGELLAQALAASQAIDDEQYRADTLAALAPQLTGDLLAQALAVAWAIGDEGNRAQALAALAPQLTGELLAQTLAAAQAIDDAWYRADALDTLAPQLTGEARQQALAQALAAAQAIAKEGRRAEALAALAPQLTGEARQQALAQALAAAQAIAEEGKRAEALAALAPQLTGEARQQALAQALVASQAIGDEGWRARALAALAPQLTGELLGAGASRQPDYRR